MSDGYFQLVTTQSGYGIKLVKARNGGAEIKGMDLTAYLDREGIAYEIGQLKTALEAKTDTILELGTGPCPAVNETYSLFVSRDKMLAVIRFQAPSSTGKRVDINEVLADLRVKKIIVGIQMSDLMAHFQSSGCYDKNVVAAKGQPPRNGKDAEVEYFFQTDVNQQPAMREDGSVDYFQLNTINHCKAGQVLARLHPADPGEWGRDIYGGRIKPKDVHEKALRYGNNVLISEDKLTLSSMVDGHVTLIDDRVFVSDVFLTENVDLSTGNLEFVGSVQVNGNVNENMMVKAGGNVVVNGVVEGARIEAGGNIIIAMGMKGMSKGSLKAGGNVICKFLENTSVEAEGYVNTESILHSNVSAGTEIVVTGKKGYITGGHMQAGNLVSVKNLGADLGNTTVVEVGVTPALKAEYMQVQREINEIVKVIRNGQPVLSNFIEKKAKGARFTQEQIKYVAETDKLIKEKTVILNQKNEQMKSIQEQMDCKQDARVEVEGTICAGTTIIIGDASMILRAEYRYCRFEKRDGEVRMLPLR